MNAGVFKCMSVCDENKNEEKKSFKNDGNLFYVKCNKYCMCYASKDHCGALGTDYCSEVMNKRQRFCRNVPHALFFFLYEERKSEL